jgi:hypothetical protein
MKPEEQRIAIAKACGWQYLPAGIYGLEDCWCRSEPNGERVRSTANLPDYLNDLNAMHEVEKSAPPEYWVKLAQLRGLNGRSSYEDLNNTFWPSLQGRMIGKIAGATAAQRAEAFLRALDLWTE